MATSAISSNDLTKIRNLPHQLTDVRINAVNPEIVATYSISGGTQAVITDISGTLTSGDINEVLVGRRVVLTDGTYTQTTTIRKSSDASNLYLNVIGEGQGGFAEKISPAQTDLTTAYVYNDFPLYGEYSRVVSKTVPILPRWDLAFSNQTSSAIPPICNAGTHQSASVNYGSTATFTLPYSGTNTSFAFGSETISSYSWSLPTGVSFVSGYSATDDVIEVNAVAGQHLISLTVTDSNSQTHTAYVWLFVDDNTTYKTLNSEFQARITNDQRDLQGRSIELEITGQIAETKLLKGSLIHIQTEQTYGGQSLTQGVLSDIFVGYVQQINTSYDGNVFTTRLSVVSPYIYLQSIATAPQVIFEASSPANWTEVTSALSNPRGALSYIRWQCQNLFSMHDIDCPYTEPRKKSYQFTGVTVGSHLQSIGQIVAGNIGSASDGTLVVRKNPVYRNNTFRNALAVGCTFNESDIVGQIAYNEPIHTVFQDVRSGAFAYNGASSSAWYGMKRWGQGAGRTEQPPFTVTVSEGRDTVLEIVGHMAQELNYPITNTLTLSRDFDVVEPVYMIWYQLNVDSSYDGRGRGWTNQKILPQSVNVVWDNDSFTKTVTITFKEETFGQPAEEYFLSSADLGIINGWEISRPVPYQPQSDLFGDLTNLAVVLNTTGQLAVTKNLLSSSPIFNDLSNYVTGNVNDVCYDYNSSFFTSGYILTEPLSMYIVSTSGTTLYIYRLDDIKAQSYTVTELETYTMSDSSNTTNARIACSRKTPTLVVTTWHDQTGIEFGRSTDGGSTWSTKANVGSATTDTNNDNVSIGLYVDNANQVITGYDGSDYHTYLATTAAGSFTKMTNSVANSSPNPMIAGDGNTTLYVATNADNSGGELLDGDFNVTFDVGGDSYTLGGTGTVIDTGSGNGGNAGQSTQSTGSQVSVISLDITIALGATYNAPTDVQIAFDHYYELNNVLSATILNPDTIGKVNWQSYVSSSGANLQYINSSGSTYDNIITSEAFAHTATMSINNEDTWQSFVSDQITTSTTSFNTIRLNYELRATTLNGSFPTSSWFNVSDASASLVIRLDNFRVYIDQDTIYSSVDPVLYKVTTYTGTPSWTDVTPATTYIPELPYGLILDKLDTDNIELFADDDTTPKWFSSTNTATNWTDNGASDYRTALKVGDSMLLGGVSAFDLTTDNGLTVTDKTGNLGVVWGSVGTIKRVLVVSE